MRPAAIQKKPEIVETKTCHMKFMLLTIFLINTKVHNSGYTIEFLKPEYIWFHMQFLMFLLICVSHDTFCFLLLDYIFIHVKTDEWFSLFYSSVQFNPDGYSEVAFQNISIKWPIDPYSCKYPQHIHLAGM